MNIAPFKEETPPRYNIVADLCARTDREERR
jgi:hypothetical protein